MQGSDQMITESSELPKQTNPTNPSNHLTTRPPNPSTSPSLTKTESKGNTRKLPKGYEGFFYILLRMIMRRFWGELEVTLG